MKQSLNAQYASFAAVGVDVTPKVIPAENIALATVTAFPDLCLRSFTSGDIFMVHSGEEPKSPSIIVSSDNGIGFLLFA